ncbi:hypothetical protein KRR38_09515 [Novosphingobium sp. G106]|uniref:hypothetical protein n=1 Tax=Novosphingobium sp. G106 TaxID=2849500 RepID=UPI001C2D39CF|nr:hypothetical protein [Novosphingobium sp. G106]MBV1687906.1 hypothetical protein [Novosphingobium sp. G106]
MSRIIIGSSCCGTPSIDMITRRGEGHGNLREVAFASTIVHASDELAGQRLDVPKDRFKTFRREVALGDLAIGQMFCAIHQDEVAHEILGLLPARRLLRHRFVRQRQQRLTRFVDEALRISLDRHDVGMPGDQPEWRVVIGLDVGQRIGLPKL